MIAITNFQTRWNALYILAECLQYFVSKETVTIKKRTIAANTLCDSVKGRKSLFVSIYSSVLFSVKWRLCVRMYVWDHNDKSVQVSSHYQTCVDLLDVFYLRRSHIYRQLSAVIADKQESPGPNNTLESYVLMYWPFGIVCECVHLCALVCK